MLRRASRRRRRRARHRPAVGVRSRHRSGRRASRRPTAWPGVAGPSRRSIEADNIRKKTLVARPGQDLRRRRAHLPATGCSRIGSSSPRTRPSTDPSPTRAVKVDGPVVSYSTLPRNEVVGDARFQALPRPSPATCGRACLDADRLVRREVDVHLGARAGQGVYQRRPRGRTPFL